MKNLITSIDNTLNPLRTLSDEFLSPLFDLAIRLYLASVFWTAGKLKLDAYLNEDFGDTVFKFEEIYPVPGIDPTLAATMATIFEPLLAILLAFGLFGRFAAGGLLAMTIVIEYAWAVQQNPYTFPFSTDHLLWGVIALGLLLRGPGKFSLDALILRFSRK